MHIDASKVTKRKNMDKYEDYLLKHYGRENSFKVPDGYFEDLAQNIMSQLPEQKAQIVELRHSWSSRLRKMVAAAVIGIVAVGGAIAGIGLVGIIGTMLSQAMMVAIRLLWLIVASPQRQVKPLIRWPTIQ